MGEHLFPLNEAARGAVLTVTRLEGGRHFRDKCIEQGILPGCRVEVMNAQGASLCLKLPAGTKIVLGEGMLRKILVSDELAEGTAQ